MGPIDILTVAQVAKIIQFTPKGVYGLVEQGVIPYIRISNRIRFLQTDVLAWLQQNRVPVKKR